MTISFLDAVRGFLYERFSGRNKVELPKWHPSNFMLHVFAVEVTSSDPDFNRDKSQFPMNWGNTSYFKVAVPSNGSVSEEVAVHKLRSWFAQGGRELNLRALDCTHGPRLSDGALEDIPPSFLVKVSGIEELDRSQTCKRTVYLWELAAA